MSVLVFIYLDVDTDIYIWYTSNKIIYICVCVCWHVNSLYILLIHRKCSTNVQIIIKYATLFTVNSTEPISSQRMLLLTLCWPLVSIANLQLEKQMSVVPTWMLELSLKLRSKIKVEIKDVAKNFSLSSMTWATSLMNYIAFKNFLPFLCYSQYYWLQIWHMFKFNPCISQGSSKKQNQ